MTTTATKNTDHSPTYDAVIFIWSAIGATPLTGRRGAFCDTLVNHVIPVTGPKDAISQLQTIARATKHASRGHVYIRDYPNQNHRTHWVNF